MATRPRRFKRFARDENEDTDQLREYLAQLSDDQKAALYALLAEEFAEADSDEQFEGTGARIDNSDVAADALAMDSRRRSKSSFARRFPDAAAIKVM